MLILSGVPLPVLGMGNTADSPMAHYLGVMSSPVQMALSLAEGAAPTGLVAPSQLLSGTALDTNVQVTFDPNLLPQNEPSISINPNNSRNIVSGANDYRLVAVGQQAWAGVYTSLNGGVSWSNQLLPGYPGGPTSVLSGFSSAGDPGVAFDRSGNVYYSGLAFVIKGTSAVDGTVFVSKSTDGGLSFPQTAITAPGSSRIFNDKPYLAIDETTGTFNGRVYVSWTRFTSTTGDIMLAFSSDGGQTFSTPLKLSVSAVNQGSVPVVGPSGELYVVWNDLSNDRIVAAKSTNGGVSFSTPIVVSGYVPLPSTLPNSNFRVNSNPAAAIDDTDGNVYAAWADYRNGNADILLSRSTDGDASWSPALRLNDDNTTNDQFFPWMTVTASRLSIDWYDRRLDPANHLMDVFYTQSTDGANTFTPDVRVTDVSSNPDAVLFSNGQSFIGDYIGIASNATVAHPVWTDMRNVSSSSTADQDIFTDVLAGHDLALKGLVSARTVVYQGVSVKPLNVTSTLENLGVAPETNVTIHFSANNTQVGSITLSSVLGRSIQNITLQWNTNSLSKGVYLVSSTVSPVLGETDLANNQVGTISLHVNFPGDLNGDKVVNLADLSVIATAYGSTSSSSNWNPLADINNDGRVNLADVSVAALNYGKVDP